MFYAHIMPGPSGFFLPNIQNSTNNDSDRLELIHSSDDGFSELYRGCKNGKFFVYKALKKEYRGNPLYEELLRKDFNIGFPLSHTGICQYFGLIDFPSIGNCIVMEWIDGRNLENLISSGEIGKGLARKIICELCDALDYIHKKQIIHRDLKPENIMITDNGYNVKIIDFGFSDADSYSSLKAPAGTRAYASPELIAGEKIDLRTDIWALGLIINELSSNYHQVAACCLRRDREKRFGSAAEVKRAVLQEPARKARNTAAVFAMVLSFMVAGWLLWNRDSADVPAAEPEAAQAAVSDTHAVPEVVVSDSLADTPVQARSSATVAAQEPIKTTPKDSQFNSGENLDADDLDDMFKDAAELIL